MTAFTQIHLHARAEKIALQACKVSQTTHTLDLVVGDDWELCVFLSADQFDRIERAVAAFNAVMTEEKENA
jgi:hypothetical protein